MSTNRIRTYVVGCASLAVLAILGSLMNSGPARAQGQGNGSAPVHIVNPLPLPVTGSLTVGAPLTIGGPLPLPVTGAVGISGPVTPSNTPASPLFVSYVETVPFQKSRDFGPIADGWAFDSESIDVPTGKLAVVEHVSASLALPPGQLIIGRITCGDGAGAATHPLLFSSLGLVSDGNAYVVANQPLRCYARGAHGLRVYVERYPKSGATSLISVAVSGHVLTP